MKFRHPTGVTLQLLSGHGAQVGTEWRELPDMFYQEALVRGCDVDKTVIESRKEADPGTSDTANKTFDEPKLIREALELMKARGESGDFIANGNPNLSIVANLVGFKANKEMVYGIWHEVENGGPLTVNADPTA